MVHGSWLKAHGSWLMAHLFFEDARHAINECFYKEVVFADDLNAYRIYPSASRNSAIKESLNNVQRELHKWGDANQVAFDAAKESQHVLSTSDPEGSSFKLLDVPFDTELSMAYAVSELVSLQAGNLELSFVRGVFALTPT